MGKANYTGTTRKWSRTDRRQRAVKHTDGTEEIDLPSGDGKAHVGVTRGFKHWFSTGDEGLTVESTVFVNVTCGQSTDEITAAEEACSNLAEKLALKGLHHMDNHINTFAGVEPATKTVDPPRRRYRGKSR